MNYKEIVDRIRQVVFDHKMLVDFGYGQISDIKTRSEGEGVGEAQGADYPYCFLNPQAHQRTETQITYNFNMILMDMAREEEGDDYQNFLAIQSDCIQYIDDIVARLYYYYKDQPEIQFNYSYTPFYERFQDDLAGATANIQIVVPTNINECIAPFEPACLATLPVFAESQNNFEYTLDPEGNVFWRWENEIFEDRLIGRWSDQFFQNVDRGNFQFTITQQLVFTEPAAGEQLPPPPVFQGAGGIGSIQPTCTSGNWPTSWMGSEPITWIGQYDVPFPADNILFSLIQFQDAAPPESAVTQLVGGKIEIGYKPF